MGHFSRGQIIMFSHLRILVVEDEYMIADDMQHELEKLGVLVIGPAPTVAIALRLLDATPVLDGASTAHCASPSTPVISHPICYLPRRWGGMIRN
jgi:CheY-like chemotaxis protein